MSYIVFIDKNGANVHCDAKVVLSDDGKTLIATSPHMTTKLIVEPGSQASWIDEENGKRYEVSIYDALMAHMQEST